MPKLKGDLRQAWWISPRPFTTSGPPTSAGIPPEIKGSADGIKSQAMDMAPKWMHPGVLKGICTRPPGQFTNTCAYGNTLAHTHAWELWSLPHPTWGSGKGGIWCQSTRLGILTPSPLTNGTWSKRLHLSRISVFVYKTRTWSREEVLNTLPAGLMKGTMLQIQPGPD